MEVQQAEACAAKVKKVVMWPLLCLIFHEPLLEQPHLV